MTWRSALTVATVGLMIGALDAGAGRAPRLAAEPLEIRYNGEKTEPFRGTISSMSPLQRTITIGYFAEARKLKVPVNCKYSITGKPKAGLGDVRVGMEVEVGCYETAWHTHAIATLKQLERKPLPAK